jgi:transcriptional regulator with GAF, ATPase, and Fis domain
LDRALAPGYLRMSDPAYQFAGAFVDVVASVVPLAGGIVVMPVNGAIEPLVVARTGNGVITVSPDLAASSMRERAVALVSPVSSVTSPDSSDGPSVLYAPLSGPDVRMPLSCVLTAVTRFTDADLLMVAALAGIAQSAYATCELFFRVVREWEASSRQLASALLGEGARELWKAIERASETKRPALVYGEPGGGKTAVAQAVHACGGRSTGPFMTADCAIPETLVDVRLWGFEWGAFTGGSPVGALERAHGGTLHLRRIERLPLEAQARLVTFLDTGVVQRMWATWSTRSDVRVVASTSADLPELVSRGAFLGPLYDRLTSHQLRIPPLRERADDIPSLADWYVHERGRMTPAASVPLSAAALQCLTAYDWPGNYRELELVIERAALHADGDTILPEHLPDLAAELQERHARRRA